MTRGHLRLRFWVLCILAGSALGAVALAPPPGSAGPATAPPLILPGQGIGPARLGQHLDELILQAGPPNSVLTQGQVWIYGFGPAGLTVRTEKNTVTEITTNDPRYKTEEGIGVGSPWPVVAETYGLSPRLVAERFVATADAVGISFTVGGGAVAAVTIIPAGAGGGDLLRYMKTRVTRTVQPAGSGLCGQAVALKEFVAYFAERTLTAYITLVDRGGRPVATSGKLFLWVNGRFIKEYPIACTTFEVFQRGQGAFGEQVVGFVMKVSGSDVPPLRPAENHAAVRVIVPPTFTFEATALFTPRGQP